MKATTFNPPRNFKLRSDRAKENGNSRSLDMSEKSRICAMQGRYKADAKRWGKDKVTLPIINMPD